MTDEEYQAAINAGREEWAAMTPAEREAAWNELDLPLPDVVEVDVKADL